MYLITQTLLSSWQYVFNCHEGSEEEAMESFIKTLNREPLEPNEAMLNGRAFEDEVYRAAAGMPRYVHPTWENGIRAVAKKFGSAIPQLKAKRGITVNGMEFLVYGILDGLRAGTIYDVKFLNKSMGSADLYGKYLESPQHPAYFYIVPEATEFIYLVSDGNDLYTEPYRREDTRFIGDVIAEFIQSIESMGLLEIYKEKWVAK